MSSAKNGATCSISLPEGCHNTNITKCSPYKWFLPSFLATAVVHPGAHPPEGAKPLTSKQNGPWSSGFIAVRKPLFLWLLRTSLDSLQCHPQVDWPMISVNSAIWPLTNAVSYEGSTIIISQLCEEQWGFKQKHFKKSVLSEIRRFFVIWPQSENGSPTDHRSTDSKSDGRFE